MVHLHNGILRSTEKEELIPFAMAWMELESLMLSEISQAVRDKYHTISPLTTDILETIILFRGGLCFALSGVEQL